MPYSRIYHRGDKYIIERYKHLSASSLQIIKRKNIMEVNESSLSRIWKSIEDHDAGAITGFRGDNTRKKNKENNRDIKIYLRSKGYSVTSVDGSYIEQFGTTSAKEVSEPSFVVVDKNDTGLLHQDLIILGQMYDQDSVLLIPKGGENAFLHGTSKRADSFPGFGINRRVGSGKYGKVSGEFFSRIRGREFAFEEVNLPDTINGIRGWKIFEREMEEKLNNFRKNRELDESLDLLKNLAGISKK